MLDPYKTVLNSETAYWMARFAKLAYTKVSETDESPGEFGILQALKTEDPGGFISVKGVNKSSAQAIFVEHKDYLCMAFRGTDELGDWLDNLSTSKRKALFGEFHSGFLQSVLDVEGELVGHYTKAWEDSRRPLFFTGHSLGGAMAAVMAARFIDSDVQFSGVYTFGQPRIMDRATSRIYNAEALERYFRFVNNEDIVTRVPTRMQGYSHGGHCVYIDKDGMLHCDPGYWYRFQDIVEGAEESLKEHGSVGAVSDHNMELYVEAIKNWRFDDECESAGQAV